MPKRSEPVMKTTDHISHLGGAKVIDQLMQSKIAFVQLDNHFEKTRLHLERI